MLVWDHSVQDCIRSSLCCECVNAVAQAKAYLTQSCKDFLAEATSAKGLGMPLHLSLCQPTLKAGRATLFLNAAAGNTLHVGPLNQRQLMFSWQAQGTSLLASESSSSDLELEGFAGCLPTSPCQTTSDRSRRLEERVREAPTEIRNRKNSTDFFLHCSIANHGQSTHK